VAAGPPALPTGKHLLVSAAAEVQIENLTLEALRAGRPDAVMNRLLPWDLTRQRPFTASYLAGFTTERRDLDFQQVEAAAVRELDRAGRRVMASELFARDGSVTEAMLTGTSRLAEWRRRYTLMPAWLLSYWGPDGRLLYFAVNGQTGEVASNLPSATRRVRNPAAVIGVVGGAVALAIFVIGSLAAIGPAADLVRVSPSVGAGMVLFFLAPTGAALVVRSMRRDARQVTTHYELAPDLPDQAVGSSVKLLRSSARRCGLGLYEFAAYTDGLAARGATSYTRSSAPTGRPLAVPHPYRRIAPADGGVQ
jgi:hypothetical protein